MIETATHGTVYATNIIFDNLWYATNIGSATIITTNSKGWEYFNPPNFTIVAGKGITITTNVSTDTITISTVPVPRFYIHLGWLPLALLTGLLIAYTIHVVKHNRWSL